MSTEIKVDPKQAGEALNKLARGGFTGGIIQNPTDFHPFGLQPMAPRRNPSPGEVIRTRDKLTRELTNEVFGSNTPDVTDVIEYLIENDLLSEKAYQEFGVKE